MSENRKDWNTYIVYVYDPKRDQRVRYDNVRAVSEAHADRQARDGYFGLLAPPDDERYNELEVEAVLCP